MKLSTLVDAEHQNDAWDWLRKLAQQIQVSEYMIIWYLFHLIGFARLTIFLGKTSRIHNGEASFARLVDRRSCHWQNLRRPRPQERLQLFPSWLIACRRNLASAVDGW